MATRKPSRSEWQLKSGKWTRSLGSRGTRVRLFQKRSGGLFYRAFWVPSRGVDRKCLGTADRAQAERLGKALLGALLKGDEIESSRALPLGTLGYYYRTRSVVYQGLSERARKEHDARMKILVAFFGKECDVRGLTQEDQIAFVRKRLAGRIFLGTSDEGKERLTAPVRQRSAQADIEVLRAILRWATTYRVREGLRLLDRNPFDGVRLPSRGTNPRRPVATHERFVETRRAIGRLRSEAESDLELRKWLKLELALVLAEATGRRLGSFRQLRWNDIDFKTDTILWRAEADKKRKEWRVPMPQALRDELRSFRVKLGGAFGGLLFPSESDPEIPIRRDVLAKWLQQAERRAGLKKLDGSLWHAYRRAWATSRKELPTADVAAAGGWSDVATLLRCYQQPDEATMLSVMSHPRKILDRVSGRN